MTEDSRKVERGSFLVCPACGGTEFYVDGFVGYRQQYGAQRGEFGSGKITWEAYHATAASCANCEKDVTDFFKKFGLLTFFTPAWKER